MVGEKARAMLLTVRWRSFRDGGGEKHDEDLLDAQNRGKTSQMCARTNGESNDQMYANNSPTRTNLAATTEVSGMVDF